jgi:hypothetical protein
VEVSMSTFKIEGAKILDWLIPEFKWESLDFTRSQQIFEKLLSTDQLGSEILEYIKKRRPRIGFHKQYKSGGGWTLFGNITLSPGDDPFDPYVLSLILHEAFHLRQSILMRLSMQGELRAWQYQKQTYPGIAKVKGNAIGSKDEAYGRGKETRELWEELSKLSPDSREDLKKAQTLMQDIAKGYRSDSLPLYPLPQEIGFCLRQGKIKDAVAVVLKLIRAGSEG